MTLARSRIGSPVFAGVTVGGNQPTFTAVARFFNVDTPEDLFIASPFLVFWEVTSTSGNIVRLVDFADPTVEGSPGTVLFDGEDYTPAKISQPEISESTSGSAPIATVDLNDPTRAILGFVRANNGLRGATVRMRVIKYTDLATPALATQRTFRVREAASLEGPPRVSVSFGPPNLQHLRYPSIDFNRYLCHNPWEFRFQHDNRNGCNHPSDEFEEQKRQVFSIASAAETEGDFGWLTRNATKADFIRVANQADAAQDNYLRVQVTNKSILWDDATRDSVLVYKHIVSSVDSDDQIDVTAKIDFEDDDLGTMIGLFVQPRNRLMDSVFFGVSADDPGYTLRSIKTANAVSTVNGIASEKKAGIRIKREGSDWKLYTRDESLTNRNPLKETAAWTLRRTETLAMNGDLNVGLLFGSLSGTATDFDGKVYHMRFLAGGFRKCLRTEGDCAIRKNTIQRNGYLGLPDNVVHF